MIYNTYYYSIYNRRSEAVSFHFRKYIYYGSMCSRRAFVYYVGSVLAGFGALFCPVEALPCPVDNWSNLWITLLLDRTDWRRCSNLGTLSHP